MSLYPLHRKVNREDSYKITHQYHQKIFDKVEPEMFLVTPKDYDFKVPGNYLDDKRLCSLKSSDYGKISGCSSKQKKIFNNPRPDTIQKITDNSFSTQVFLEPYKKTEDSKKVEILPGIEYNNYHNVNFKNNYGELYETNELDDKDYYQKYCSNKYKRFFENN